MSWRRNMNYYYYYCESCRASRAQSRRKNTAHIKIYKLLWADSHRGWIHTFDLFCPRYPCWRNPPIYPGLGLTLLACDFLSLGFCLLLVFIWGPFTYEAVQLSINHDSMTPHRLFKYMNFMHTLSSGSLTSTNMPRPWVAGRYSSLCLSYSWVR